MERQQDGYLVSRGPDVSHMASPSRQCPRQITAGEIYSTELRYRQVLQRVIQAYMLPLLGSDRAPIIEKESVVKIFSSLQTIERCSALLSKDLESRIISWGPMTCVGDIFISFAPFFKLYEEYVKNYKSANEHLRKLRKSNKLFAKFLKETREANPGELDLVDYLIQPVQRIPRYNLLLQQVIKYTPHDHPDRKDLQKALEATQTAASFINERVSEFEAEQEIIRVQKLFVSDSKKRADLVVPGRRIVKQGPVFRKSSSSYCLFLFNDLVVLAKKVFGSKFEPKTQVSLLTTDADMNCQESHQGMYGLSLKAPNKSWDLFLVNSTERDQWLTAINDTKCELFRQRSSSIISVLERTPAVMKNAEAEQTRQRRSLNTGSSADVESESRHVVEILTGSPAKIQIEFNNNDVVSANVDTRRSSSPTQSAPAATEMTGSILTKIVITSSKKIKAINRASAEQRLSDEPEGSSPKRRTATDDVSPSHMADLANAAASVISARRSGIVTTSIDPSPQEDEPTPNEYTPHIQLCSRPPSKPAPPIPRPSPSTATSTQKPVSPTPRRRQPKRLSATLAST